ncbi:hypothetical protein CEQ90_17790 [Lewinellaceae bacterium SD302]|nr:hypothetical protein CEQ90_17790 [Lewinellaceae bacterium SD302]
MTVLMRTAFLLLFTLLLCQPQLTNAQSAEDWQTYVDVTRINSHFDLEDRILLATDGGISIYDKASKQITERWTRATHGLPSNMIEAVVQHPQSQQLIIGTYDLGVFRQVGSEVSDWEPVPLPENINTDHLLTYCLAHDDQGRLLVGNNKGLFIQENNDEWLHFGPNQTNNFLHEVWEMLTTPDGTVYAGGNITMEISQGEVNVHTPVPLSSGHSDSLQFSYGDRKLHLTPDGDLWSISDIGQLTRFTAVGEWELYGWPFNHLDLVFSVDGNNFLDPEGRLYLQTFNDDYYRFQDGEFMAIEPVAAISNLENIFLNGNELIGYANDSLYSVDATNTSSFAGKMGNWPWSERVTNLFNDLEGNCWARYGSGQIINLSQGEILQLPTNSLGSNYYRDVHFTNSPGEDVWLQSSHVLLHWQDRQELIDYPFASGQSSSTSWSRSSLVTEDGTPWFTTDEREVYTLIGGEWTRQLELPVNHYISSLTPFPDNRVLVTVTSFMGPNQAWLLGPGVAEPYSFGDNFNWDNYWSPFQGEEPGSIWFYDHNNNRLVNYYQGIVDELDLPADWPEPQLIRSFREKDGNILVAIDRLVAIHDGTEWTVYDHDNAPIETSPISAANLDADGVLRITHSTIRRAMEVLQTDLVSSTEETAITTRLQKTIKVFPNPASNWIIFPSKQISDYQIYNSAGKMVSSGTAGIGNVRVDVASLTPGVYHLRLGRRAASFLVKR